MSLGLLWAVLLAWWTVLLVWAAGDALQTRDAAALGFCYALLSVLACGVLVGLAVWAS